MEKIFIEATTNTPKVVLDPDKMIFEISGESRPKDASKFYIPILQWLDELGNIITKQYIDYTKILNGLKKIENADIVYDLQLENKNYMNGQRVKKVELHTQNY